MLFATLLPYAQMTIGNITTCFLLKNHYFRRESFGGTPCKQRMKTGSAFVCTLCAPLVWFW